MWRDGGEWLDSRVVSPSHRRMNTRHDMDAKGTSYLILFFLILVIGQVMIKLIGDGLQPVFAAGLRSGGSALVVLVWMKWRGIRLDIAPGTWRAGLLIGLVFSVQFLSLFTALDLTTVTRVSVIFYSMPLWMAVAAHFLLPGEQLTPVRLTGLALAFAGVVWAIVDRSGLGGEASLIGDVAALVAAWSWVGVSLTARLTPIARVRPEMQLLWQLAVSTPVLIVAALFFGPLIRDFTTATAAMMLFQIVIVSAGTFLVWFWMLTYYKASQISAFAFLSPIFGVGLGWLWLGEVVTLSLIIKLALVAVGIVLINRPQGQR